MIDWITLTIELVGLAIFLTWIVLPVREFRQILRVVRHKPHPLPDGGAIDSRRGFPVSPNPTPRPREDGPRG